MATSGVAHGRSRPLVRRVLLGLLALGLLQLATRALGQLAGRRYDEGDETSSRLRRVRTMDGLNLRPTSQELSDLRFDLALAGVELDLTEARPAPGGVDIWFNLALAGGNVRVPEGWTVATDGSGIGGGMGVSDGIPTVESEDASKADVRVHLRAFLGGLGISR